MSELSVVVHP